MGTNLTMSGGLPVKFFISDPGSYLYLTNERPTAECRPLRNNGVNDPATLACASFAVPPEFASNANCSDYDVYKYGIANMSTGGGTNTYNVPLDENPALKVAAKVRFGTKDLVFILGEEGAQTRCAVALQLFIRWLGNIPSNAPTPPHPLSRRM